MNKFGSDFIRNTRTAAWNKYW